MNCRDGNWGLDSEEKLISVMDEIGLDLDMCVRHSENSGSPIETPARYFGPSSSPSTPYIRTSQAMLDYAGGACLWKRDNGLTTCGSFWGHGSRLCKCVS